MNRFVVLDFETYPVNGKSYIMEIGCVEVVNGTIGNSYHTLVRPVDVVSSFVLKLTGITESELSQAPEFKEITDDFYAFIGDSTIVAHNAQLDCLSYESFCAWLNIQPKLFDWVDSQDIVKIMDPCAQTLQLQRLLDGYGLRSTVSHRAKEDALGLAKLIIFYVKERRILMESKELAFLTHSSLRSIRLLVGFLSMIYTVSSPKNDQEPIKKSLKHVPFGKDNHPKLQLISDSSEALFTTHIANNAYHLVVTNHWQSSNHFYILDPTLYAFPHKISRLYPMLTNQRASHMEVVEIVAVMNWLRQTNTFCLTDLNDQLMQRYNQTIVDVFDTHPMVMATFIEQQMVRLFAESRVVGCHYDALILVMDHLPQSLTSVCVVLRQFIHFNQYVSKKNEVVFSFRLIKRSLKLMLNLAYVIEYLSSIGQDNLMFVQDFARLKSVAQAIHEEKIQLFQKADYLVDILSVAIFNHEHRQVLINQNVVETMEWQELIGSINMVIHNIQKLVGLLKKISFYITPDLGHWVFDLVYSFESLAQCASAFLSDASKKVLYIEAPVKHKAANCKLVIKNINEHEFYVRLVSSCQRLLVHQPLCGPQMQDVVAESIGQSVAITGESGHSFDAFNISVKCISSKKAVLTVSDEAKENEVAIVLFSKKQMRVWKHQLRSPFKLDKPSTTQWFLYHDFVHRIDCGESMGDISKIIFPEFFTIDLYQPIHNARLSHSGECHDTYIQKEFSTAMHAQILATNMHQIAPVVVMVDAGYQRVLADFI
jgi:DNA polymerase III epsilon subunit family exonuclease